MSVHAFHYDGSEQKKAEEEARTSNGQSAYFSLKNYLRAAGRLGEAPKAESAEAQVNKSMVQKMAKDSGALMEIGQSYAGEAQALLKKSTANFAGVAKAKAKKS